MTLNYVLLLVLWFHPKRMQNGVSSGKKLPQAFIDVTPTPVTYHAPTEPTFCKTYFRRRKDRAVRVGGAGGGGDVPWTLEFLGFCQARIVCPTTVHTKMFQITFCLHNFNFISTPHTPLIRIRAYVPARPRWCQDIYVKHNIILNICFRLFHPYANDEANKLKDRLELRA